MSNELREAAERRRKPYPRASVSGGAAYVSLWIHEDEWSDINKLADAYADEHPPDDETPIDEAWLFSVGFVLARIEMCGEVLVRPYPTRDGDCHWVEWCRESQFISLLRRSDEMDEHELPPDIVSTNITTRGQLRRLCAALGITLKESP